MSEFMFVYRGGNRAGSPAEMQATMQKWVAWMKELDNKGAVKSPGNPLDSGGAVVRKGKSVTDGPYAEKDAVCGFTVVEARDLAHAADLSAGCPIFDGGGLVEIRPVLQMRS
jgi:hypothetical protein